MSSTPLQKPPVQSAQGRGRQASSTSQGKDYARAFFNKWQTEIRHDPPLDDLEEIHVEGDNLEHILGGFADYLIVTEILQNNSTGKLLSSESKRKYFERTKDLMYRKFKKHECWVNDSWYQTLRKQVESSSLRKEFQNGADDYKDPSVRPIYSKIIDPAYLRITARASNGWRTQQGIDLSSITKSLLKKASYKNKNCEKRAVLLCNFLAMGRGGESKFLRWDEWFWDPLLELTDAIWTQMKTLEKWPITFGPDYHSYENDFYHAFHCFFLIDDGLYRTPAKERIAKFVFPRLHKMQNDNVSRKVTSWLRDECDAELRDRTSSKSLRKGANNELAMNRLIQKQERLVRGGWAATDTSDTAAYREVNPALTYPPMLALAGWPDPHARIHPMRLPLDLGDENLRAIQVLAETIYLSNIEKFEQLPHILPPFVYTCVAAGVMYHPQMYIDHGPNNVVVEKMIDRVIESKLAATRESSHQLLCSWATTIKDDFRAQNMQVERATELNLVEVVNQQSVLIKELCNQRRDDALLQQQKDITMEKLVHGMSLLSQEFTASAKRKAPSSPSSDPGSPSPKRSRLEPAATLSPLKNLGSLSPLKNLESLSRGDNLQHLKISLDDGPRALFGTGELRFGQRGAAVASQRNSNIEVSTVLIELYNSGQLRKANAVLSLTRYLEITNNNASKYKSAMRLVQESWTPEQEDKLRSKNGGLLDEIQLHDVAMQVEQACLQRMASLEGRKDVGRTKAKIIGLGLRHLVWERGHQDPPKTQSGIVNFFSKAVETITSPMKARTKSQN
jgi:hypothetical protein